MKDISDNNSNICHMTQAQNTVAILLAAGKGNRAGLGLNKALHMSGTCTVLERSYAILRQVVQAIVVVVSQADFDAVSSLLTDDPLVVVGGTTRFDSVRLGLQAIVDSQLPCDIVTIHDSARCFVEPQLIEDSIKHAKKFGSGIAAIKTIDTIKTVVDNQIVTNIDRATTYSVQTPQSFGFEAIYKAYTSATQSQCFTDDSSVYASLGFVPHIVEGNYDNTKLTHPNDFLRLPNCHSIGHGYDVHQLVANRKLILGGITVDYSLGLLGHSDADVLTHAIMDAMLGAAHLPDIGVCFDDSDPKYKDADSTQLLKIVNQKVQERGYSICNISAVIIAQSPKLSHIIPSMEKSLANALCVDTNKITISATTTESLGIVGQNKAMAASAVCLLEKYKHKDNL